MHQARCERCATAIAQHDQLADLLTVANARLHQADDIYEVNRRQLQAYWERALSAEAALAASSKPSGRFVRLLISIDHFLRSIDRNGCPSCRLHAGAGHRYNCRLVSILNRIADTLR